MGSPPRALVLVVTLSICLSAAASAFVGGYRPITNLRDPYVIEVANFALAEHNRRAGENLLPVKLLQASSQVVAGTNYRLVFTARNLQANGYGEGKYVAVVWDKIDNTRELTDFRRLG